VRFQPPSEMQRKELLRSSTSDPCKETAKNFAAHEGNDGGGMELIKIVQRGNRWLPALHKKSTLESLRVMVIVLYSWCLYLSSVDLQ